MKLTDKEIFASKIGRRLKEIRISKGYSSYETFANDIDMTRSQYWSYENGSKNITVFTLLRILKQHHMTLEEFFSVGFD